LLGVAARWGGRAVALARYAAPPLGEEASAPLQLID